jgi:hypothetical protein
MEAQFADQYSDRYSDLYDTGPNGVLSSGSGSLLSHGKRRGSVVVW